MVLFNAMVDITLAAIGISIISRVIQNKFMDKKKMKRQQEELKEKQKRAKELMAKTDSKSKQELERLQSEMLKAMSESMQGSMRYMLVSLPLFFGLWAVLRMFYGTALIDLPVALPVLHPNGSIIPTDWSFEITSTLGYVWWYVYSAFATSGVISIILKAWDKKNEQKPKEVH